MSRWRYTGPGWAVSDPVHVLGMQLEQHNPLEHGADGTVASSSHAQWPDSDHGIDPAGIVRAIDIGVFTAADGLEIAEQLRATRDPRLRYVIHAGRIFGSYDHAAGPAWQWRPYRGLNPHLWHVHVSMQRDATVDRDGTPFDIDLGGHVFTIEQLQEALVAAGHDIGDSGPNGDGIDGDYGPRTKAALVEALSGGAGVTPRWVRELVDRRTANVVRKGDTITVRGAGE